jgi:hypothetical protein
MLNNRVAARGRIDNRQIALGETATVGIAALISGLASSRRDEIAASESVGALVFGCEGVTDRRLYDQLLAEKVDEWCHGRASRAGRGR